MLKKTFKDHFLFKNKSIEVITSIISSLILKTYEKDVTLFKKGNEGSDFYIKKRIILIITDYGDKYLKDWETFGELYALNGITFREILKKINESDLNEILDLLKSNTLFNILGNNTLKSICNIMIKCTFKGGET